MVFGVKIYPTMAEYEQFDYGGFVAEERIGVNNYAYFVYDDMLVELGSKSEIVIDDNDFFSRIKIGYIEIE